MYTLPYTIHYWIHKYNQICDILLTYIETILWGESWCTKQPFITGDWCETREGINQLWF